MRQTERAIQAAGVRLLRHLGTVLVFGTTRRRGDYPGSMQTPGIPDVKVFLRARDGSPARGLWWEVKAPGGRVRPEQAAIHAAAVGCGEAVVVGGIDVLIGWLIAHGYVAESQVAHYYATGQP